MLTSSPQVGKLYEIESYHLVVFPSRSLPSLVGIHQISRIAKDIERWAKSLSDDYGTNIRPLLAGSTFMVLQTSPVLENEMWWLRADDMFLEILTEDNIGWIYIEYWLQEYLEHKHS